MKIPALLSLSLVLVVRTFSQVVASDSLRVVEILSAERYGYEKKDSLTELQILVGNVRLKQENTFFTADSAVYNKNARIVEAFGNVHINDNDSINTYSQYLLYRTNTKIAYLKNKVRLTDSRSSLFTNELEYDVNQQIGIYRNGGRVVNGSSVLTSGEGTYYADLKDVYFKKNVILKDPEYNLTSDSLLYNTTTEIATFIAQTLIVDSAGRTILARDGYYDLKSKRGFFGKRPEITDGAVRVVANEIEADDQSGINKLRGNAVFIDTAQGVSVLANFIEANSNDNSFLATQDPLMIIKQDKDSIFITADTLYSGRLSSLHRDSLQIRDSTRMTSDSLQTDSTDRYFQAYHHVRVYSDSLQSVSDSLFYSLRDSTFQLFNDPILWIGRNQITGDTIYLYTKNKKADRLYVFENGMAINEAGQNIYNQVRGNRLFGYFNDGELDYMTARGNAESVYYVKDDDELLVGINKASSDIIDMRFRDKELHRVVFISEVKGTMYPVNQISSEEVQLRNFKWNEEVRPKSKFELFGK